MTHDLRVAGGTMLGKMQFAFQAHANQVTHQNEGCTAFLQLFCKGPKETGNQSLLFENVEFSAPLQWCKAEAVPM
jgi:hypothetical protein